VRPRRLTAEGDSLTITFATRGNHRVAIVRTGVFFIGGLLLPKPVQMARGAREAAAAA
jgi:MFS transporter, UMF1 family